MPLQRLAGEAVAEQLRPGDREAAVGRPQRRDGDAGCASGVDPAAVGAKPRPAGAAQRQHGGVGRDRNAALRRLEEQRAAVVPAGPAVPQLERDARRGEPRAATRAAAARPSWPSGTPARWSRRRSAGPAPRTRRAGGRRERLDAARSRGAARRSGRATARSGSLWVRLSPPRPAIRNLRPDRRHALVNRDAGAAARQHFGGHQPGRAAADDRHLGDRGKRQVHRRSCCPRSCRG